MRGTPRTRCLVAALPAAMLVTLAPVSTASGLSAGTNGRIAFERESVAGDHTQVDILTVQPGATTATRLTTTPNRNEFGPAWSPDGTTIAFWRTPAPFGPGSLWVMNADGSNANRLTSGVDARDPSWNPAGTRLVFQKGFDLHTVSASGGELTRITKGPTLDFEPAWSPNGRRIAFTRGHETGDVGDIVVLDRRTGTISRVTRSSAYDHQVEWAPDGRHLVFERDFTSASAIVTVRPDGSHLRRLTTGSHFDLAPAWSPDGSRIAFGSDRASWLVDLWVMRPDGTRLRELFGTPKGGEGNPDW